MGVGGWHRKNSQSSTSKTTDEHLFRFSALRTAKKNNILRKEIVIHRVRFNVWHHILGYIISILVELCHSSEDLWFSYECNGMEYNSIGCIQSYPNIGQAYFYDYQRMYPSLVFVYGLENERHCNSLNYLGEFITFIIYTQKLNIIKVYLFIYWKLIYVNQKKNE